MKQTVPPYLTRLAITAGVAAGLDRSRLIGIPGLAALAEDGVRIPTTSAIRVWELIAEVAQDAQDDGASSRVMASWRPGMLGVWDYLFTTADTLTDAMRAGVGHFAALGDPSSSFIIARDAAGLTVSWRSRYDDHLAYVAHTEFVLALLLAEASSGVGRPLTPVSVRLPYSAPSRHERLIDLYGTRRIDFDAGLPSITFSEADADTRLPRADPALQAILDDHATTTVATARPVLGWLDRFHAALHAAFAAGPPDLAQVAHRLAMGPRTVQRRLREEGTSWREEVERVRQRQVEQMLRQTSLSVESIATRVGYSDPRALRRAIHRWYGHGPAAIRAATRRRIL
ncbi:MAG: helix-turn-helix domain-containing protein [Nonomuraea sp.]|nr:helix-turn-helix domain-containing protein [Nonomuraea sp.]